MNLPKVDLHVHLEGSAPPSLMQTIAQRNGITLDPSCIANGHYVWSDFLSFLKVFDAIALALKTPRDYYDITLDLLKQSAALNTLYVEMMFSPEHAERSSGIDAKLHLQAIVDAIVFAQQHLGIIGRILITCVRHYGTDSAIKVAQFAAENRSDYVVGFGMGGDEEAYPAPMFLKAYQIAHEAGLDCTVHAGEMAGPESIRQALEHLPITRIGHGIQAINDTEVLAMIRDRGIVLEVCPSSNVATGVVGSFEQHPLPQLLNQNIKIALGSDDPPYFDTNIAKEYQRSAHYFALSEEQLLNITKTAIEAAFLDNEQREQLLARL